MQSKFQESACFSKIYISDETLGSDTVFKCYDYSAHLASYILLKEYAE